DTGDTTNHIMTSSDGISWANTTTAYSVALISLAYGNGILVATAYSTNNILTSGSALGLSLAAQNTLGTLTASGDIFKLRQLVTDTVAVATSTFQQLKLQYAAKSGTCDTSFSGETYK